MAEKLIEAISEMREGEAVSLTKEMLVGGGTVDDHVRVYSGADAFGSDAVAAVSLAKQWVGGN
jgi:methanogenic corrinoid protein MtbC1